MHSFLGVVGYEYRMSVRRWGLWLAFGLASVPYLTSMAPADPAAGMPDWSGIGLWQYTGEMAFMMNLMPPVVAGIAIADRLVRDDRFGVSELLHSTPLKRWTYILGKYLGALLSVLTPVFLLMMALILVSVAFGMPVVGLPAGVLAFLAIVVPAYAFITAFSVACPAVMPVRVYQVLFTGYWFWGNFLNPEAFPTLAGTLLTPSGRYVLEGFFGGRLWNTPDELSYTSVQAVLNLLVLGLCIAIALVSLERFLAWRARRA